MLDKRIDYCQLPHGFILIQSHPRFARSLLEALGIGGFFFSLEGGVGCKPLDPLRREEMLLPLAPSSSRPSRRSRAVKGKGGKPRLLRGRRRAEAGDP